MVSLALAHASCFTVPVQPPMKPRPLDEIMSIAEKALANGTHVEQPKGGLSAAEQVLWEREARLLWRLTKPLESVHGPRRKRHDRGWRSPLARGL